jgi:hypothetical protein
MTRRLEIFGVALVAVIASAFAASVSQATPQLVAGITVHGTGENVGEAFTVDGVTTQCQVSHYTGTAINGATSITLTPTYTNCTLAGTGLTVHVKTSGCGYLMQLTGKSGATYNSTVDIECPAGAAILIEGTGTSCEAAVGAQTGLSNVAVTNDATDVTIKPNVTGIAATVVKDGFLCPFNGTGPKTGGKYVTSSDITGTADGGGIQVSE